MKPRWTTFALALLLPTLLAAPAHATRRMGWYWPIYHGARWVFENADAPGDTFSESVFAEIDYEGHTAYRVGPRTFEHIIMSRAPGGILTLRARVVAGVLQDLDEDLVLGDVADGDIFELCFSTPCDSSLIREWSALDPSLRTIYGLESAPADMFLFASYDRDYPPNLQNVVVESNLPPGVTPPSGAVTSLDWYERSVGPYALWDVDADSGGLEDLYLRVEVSTAVGAGSPPPLADVRAAPNPFNPRLVLTCEVATAATLALHVYDLGGRRVATPRREAHVAPGPLTLTWDGRDDRGRDLPSGVYFVRFASGDWSELRKVTLLR